MSLALLGPYARLIGLRVFGASRWSWHFWSWLSFHRRFILRQLASCSLLVLGLCYASLSLTAEWMYARAAENENFPLLAQAQQVFPLIHYIRRGPADACLGIANYNSSAPVLACLEDALLLDPYAPDLWHGIAAVNARLGRLDRAQVAYIKYKRLVPHGFK